MTASHFFSPAPSPAPRELTFGNQDLAYGSPRQYAVVNIFDTEAVAAAKERHGRQHAAAEDHAHLRSPSPLLIPQSSSSWFEDILQMEHETMMLADDGNHHRHAAGKEAARAAQVDDPSDMTTEDRKVIGVKAACHKFLKLQIMERAPPEPPAAADAANVSSPELSPRATQSGGGASKNNKKSHDGARWVDLAKVNSSGRARMKKKTVELPGQLRVACIDAVSGGQVGVFHDSVWDTSYHPGGAQQQQQHVRDTAIALPRGTATTTTATVGAAAGARAASFAPASRVVSRLMKSASFPAPASRVAMLRRVSSQQRDVDFGMGSLDEDLDAPAAPTATTQPGDADHGAVVLLPRESRAEMKDEDVAALKHDTEVANLFPAGATSISAALDAIDQSHLLPAMARLEQHRDKATKIQGDVPLLQRCSSTSLDSMPREKDAKVAKMSSGDALRPHAGAAGFCDEKHTASRAFQSEVRGTKSANSSDSTWLSPVILEHRVVGNPEGVHDSYLDHARKLGSLLANAVVDNRLAEAHESYMTTVPLWRVEDVLADANNGAAVDTMDAAVAADPGPTGGMAHAAPHPLSRADEEQGHELFSGEEGHELFIRLLMEGGFSDNDSAPSDNDGDEYGDFCDADIDFEGAAGAGMQDSRLVGQMHMGLDFAAMTA